jgi:hypothetical protein
MNLIKTIANLPAVATANTQFRSLIYTDVPNSVVGLLDFA